MNRALALTEVMGVLHELQLMAKAREAELERRLGQRRPLRQALAPLKLKPSRA